MFKNLFKSKKDEVQLIAVIEYHSNYSFETYYKIETGLWKRTDLVSFVTKDISSKEITELILKHLDLSKTLTERKVDFDKMYENYKKITNLTSIKKQMTNAKLVQIQRKDHILTFTPTINGGTKGDNKGFQEISKREIKIINPAKEKLTEYLLKSFENCE